MLRRFKGGATVTCDVPGCPHTFRSFSKASIVRDQASVEKWTYRQPTKLERDAVRAGVPIVYDRCPTHSVVAAAPVAEPATVSIAAAAEPEKLVSRDSVELTTETTSLVSGQPEASAGKLSEASAGAETVGGDRLSLVPPPRKRRARREAPAVVEPAPRKPRERMALPGTLAIVVEILRVANAPLSAREIVARADGRLPSKSKTPETVVSRDLALAVKHGGDTSIFVRVARGRFTLRELALASTEVAA